MFDHIDHLLNVFCKKVKFIGCVDKILEGSPQGLSLGNLGPH